jgi:hypothetical protein
LILVILTVMVFKSIKYGGEMYETN